MYAFPLLYFTAALILTFKADYGQAANLPESPCPEIFQYELVDKEQGILKATLLVRSPHVLHGVWIRVHFDRDVDELIVGDNFGEVVRREGNTGFLIKNKDTLLRSGRGEVLKISAKFSGSEIPKLIEYRLNAVTLCSIDNSNGTNFYPNDLVATSLHYLETVISNSTKKSDVSFQCGQLEKEQSTQLYPWQASLFVEQELKEQYTCQATLISPKYLITAAHCVVSLENNVQISLDTLKVYFGKHNIHQNISKFYTFSNILIYPGYEQENLLNDIALLELKESIPVTNNNIQPICLPTKPTLEEEEGVIVGYQVDKHTFNELVSTKVKKVSNERCFQASESLKRLIGDNTYCAAYFQDNAICVGDSGSGSVSSTAGRWELKGILSVGVPLQSLGNLTEQKCNDNSNLLFTEIHRYSKWIKGIISQ